MKIVILDGYTVNPGDIGWNSIKELGDLTVYDRTAEDEIILRAKDAEIILINKTRLNSKTIDCLKNCKYIGLMSTGCDAIDLSSAKEHGIVVTNVPSYSTMAVAQMTFAFILHFYNKIALHNDLVKSGEWSNCKDFCFWNSPLTELSGKTIGLIGFGKTGTAVAKIALAFNMKVLAYKPSVIKYDGVMPVSQEEIFKKSDIISLHLPYSYETYHLINKNTISLMKKSAILINTSRGLLINDNDLADSLNNDEIAGAALDVLSTEPPKSDNPLLTAKNCIITPHIAWASFETRKALMKTITENLKSFINGKKQNIVN